MSERVLMKGNEAIAIGALKAGLQGYFGYPITPSTEVAETLAVEFEKGEWPDYQVYMQASSELEAANMTLGAAAAGLRSMTFTASPGFSLKQEALSYGVGMELPFIIGNVNRGGPGLGNLGAEQTDYWQVTRGGGHGGYRIPVYAPCSVQEIVGFPRVAFEVAERYRQPVIMVFDSFTGQVKEDVDPDFDVTSDLHKGPGPVEDLEYHWDFDVARDTWSVGRRREQGPRARRVVCSLNLDLEQHEAHSNSLADRWNAIAMQEALWETVDVEDADVLVVAYGLPARITRAAMDGMRADGLHVGLLRPATLYPFPSRAIAELAPQLKGIVVVELNHGQMIDDVRAAAVTSHPTIPIVGVNRTGGTVPKQQDVEAAVRDLMARPGGRYHHPEVIA